MYTLAILGGGIHGSLLFVNLPQKVQKKTIVVDQYKEPCFRFVKQCTSVGVHYLRSPASHILSSNLNDLFLYVHRKKIDKESVEFKTLFSGRYYTPSLTLFLEHSNTLFKKHKIKDHWLQAIVQGLHWNTQLQSWNIKTKTSSIKAQHVIVALGMDNNISPPFSELLPTSHVLHMDYKDPPVHKKKDVTATNKKPIVSVIGGGMSGVQTALRLSATQKYVVHLFSYHCNKNGARVLYKTNHFDSKPCFIGPKCLPIFLQTKNYSLRSKILQDNRYPGTINVYVAKKLQEALHNNTLKIYKVKVEDVQKTGTTYQLHLDRGNSLQSDFVVCATGYNVGTPHHKLICPLAKNYSLPLFKNKTPILKSDLEWLPKKQNIKNSIKNLYLTGALAELELGPAAKNIIGAHLALRRLQKIWRHW